MFHSQKEKNYTFESKLVAKACDVNVNPSRGSQAKSKRHLAYLVKHVCSCFRSNQLYATITA